MLHDLDVLLRVPTRTLMHYSIARIGHGSIIQSIEALESIVGMINYHVPVVLD